MSECPTFRTAIRLRSVSKEFAAGAGNCTASVAALDSASVEIRGGEVLLVCGPPGAGKTTLLLCAAGLLHCDTGDVVGGGRRVVYVDIDRAAPSLGGWPAGAVVLLDSCDDLGELKRATVAQAVAAALATGAAVVLAARDPESCMTLIPQSATVSVLHLRRGQITSQRRGLGVVARVAEAVGGGY